MKTSPRLQALRDAASAQIAAKASDCAPMPPKEDDEETLPEDADSADGKKKKEPKMSDETITKADHDSAVAKAAAEASAAQHTRLTAVLASEEFKGRETLAATLLGNAELSADSVIAALKSAPKPVAADGDDAEFRAKMLAALENQGEDIGSGGDAPKAANHGWDDIHAEIRNDRKI